MSLTRIRTMKLEVYPELNLWHFVFKLKPIWHRGDTYIFELGIFKLHNLPDLGERYQSKHYKGFWLRRDIIMRGFGFTHNFPNEIIFPDKKTKENLSKKVSSFTTKEKVCEYCKNPIKACCFDLSHTHIVCECIVGYDLGSPEGDKTVAVIGHRDKDGTVKIDKIL